MHYKVQKEQVFNCVWENDHCLEWAGNVGLPRMWLLKQRWWFDVCILCTQRPHKATQEEMTKFHSDDYIKFLRSIRPDNMSEFNKQMQRCVYFFTVAVAVSVYC